MLKKTITYEDFNGNEQTEELYFNMTKAELVELQYSTEGGYDTWLKQIAATNNTKEILGVFRKVINASYGVRSSDGKKFVKSPEFADAFYQTAAYDALFMELIQDADAFAAFMNALVPANLAEEARKLAEKNEKSPSQIARERSEAQMQGHKTVTESDPVTVIIPPLESNPVDTSVDPEYAAYLAEKQAKQNRTDQV